MLTGGELAALIVACFWAILVSFLAYALLRLARLLGETAELVGDLTDQAGPCWTTWPAPCDAPTSSSAAPT
ncbi:hypothetical protein [Thermomonospora umbrina]|uniref:hypothetical protein n=1 Tax=Thermomonospora umbrina TaxID=111806 RepID=UPI001FE7C10F|nr:hypothetical protein [Thermomonospora umbrina]